MSHTITPRVSLSKNFGDDRLNFTFGASIPVTISSESSKQYQTRFSSDEVIYKDGQSNYSTSSITNIYTDNTDTPYPNIDISRLQINANLRMGAAYQLIPGRFSVNAGVGLNPVGMTRTARTTSYGSKINTKTETRYDANGNKLYDTVSYVNGNGDPTSYPTSETFTSTTRTDFYWSSFYATASGGFTFNFNEKMAVDMMVNGGSSSGSFTLNIANVQVMFSLKY